MLVKFRQFPELQLKCHVKFMCIPVPRMQEEYWVESTDEHNLSLLVVYSYLILPREGNGWQGGK